MNKSWSGWLLAGTACIVLAIGAGCGGSKQLKMVPRIFNVTATAAAQVAEDRKQVISLLDDLAGKHGLIKDAPPPAGVLAAYASPPSKLGLSIAVVEEGDGNITTVALSPAALGLDLNAARRNLIDAVESALKQAFGERCKPAS
jgi:hypothetical protein